MKRSTQGSRGFALLLTLGLVSLSLLLMLGLVAVIRLEAQATANAEELAKARANARLGLRMAIGQLQRYTGSVSGVVTARADVAGGTWSNPAWTGVWNEADSGGAVTWLVSGNEVSPLALTPGTALNGADDIFMLRRNLPVAEQVKARRVTVSSAQPGEGTSRPIARYAYWVSDESLKVSLNVRTDTAPVAGMTRYPVPRVDSALTGLSISPTNDASRGRLLVVDQVLFLSVSALTLNARWPEVTAAAPRLYVSGIGSAQLVPGSFNANSRSLRAWSSYLDTLTMTTSSANAFAAIRDASRPFRSLADFNSKLAVATGVGAGNAAVIVDGLSPILGVRGDTFLVRAYGESLNPALDPSDPNYVSASAYCEALVQRTPTQAGASGYRYIVTYFRWLAPSDI